MFTLQLQKSIKNRNNNNCSKKSLITQQLSLFVYTCITLLNQLTIS